MENSYFWDSVNEEMNTRLIMDCSDPRLIEAIDSSWFELFRVWGSTPYAEAQEDEDFKRMTFGDAHNYNGIFFARLTNENLYKKIDEFRDYFKKRGLPVTWWVGPTSKPADLGRRLEAHGFIHTVDMPGMAVELDRINENLEWAQDLKIKNDQDDETLRHWCGVLFPTYGLGDYIDSFLAMETHIGFDSGLPRRSYVGYLNEKPVATSHLLLTCGVAGIFCVATIPEVRHKGIGTAMTVVPLREARKMGYSVGVLQSSRMGYNVYRRIGFEEYCKIHIYRSQEES